MNKQEAIQQLKAMTPILMRSGECTLEMAKAQETAISALEQQLNGGWIPISERLPENDNPVEVTARRKEGARGYFIYKACYVAPHTQTTEDYGWDIGNVDGEYDEENDCFWVPECWYEDNAIADNGNYILDDEFDILAWRELPEPYKEDKDEN
jgi:hypothetical protein